MVKNQFERTLGLLGENTFNKICESKICLVGLGGVGGTVFETLIRSGFNDIMIIDYDVVSESNLNRQVLYTLKDLNQNKVEIAKKRALSINIDAKITSINSNINDLDLEIIKNYHPSFIIDAIDNVEGKIRLAQFAASNGIEIIMSLGMANRLDPSQVKISRLDKTTHDPLAKKMRYEIKQNGLDTKAIKVVYSLEEPLKDLNKLHSMMMVPSEAGLLIVKEIISILQGKQ